MNGKEFYIGCKVKILGTGTDFLNGSIGKMGFVVEVDGVDCDCLVGLEDNYGLSFDNKWYYKWDELELVSGN